MPHSVLAGTRFMDRKAVQFVGFITPALMVMSQLTLPSFVCQLFTLLWESCTRLARKEASGVNFKTANFGFIVCLVIESGDGNENAASCILNFPLWT